MEVFSSSINERIIYEISSSLFSIKEKLENNGIIISFVNFNTYFRIFFNLNKINKNSLAFKYKINEIVFNLKDDENFSSEIYLFNNKKIIYIEEICGHIIYINNLLFGCKKLLKEIFKFIGFNIYVEEIYYEDLQYKKYEHIFNNIIKNFETYNINNYSIFKKHFEILKIYNDKMNFSNDIEKQLMDEFKTFKIYFINVLLTEKNKFIHEKNKLKKYYNFICMKINNSLDKIKKKIITPEEKIEFENIKKEYEIILNNLKSNIEIYENKYFQNKCILKEKTINFLKNLENKSKNLENMGLDLKKNFILSTLFFEKILFSETFNCISENTTIDGTTEFLKDIYIKISYKIYKYFDNEMGKNISYSIKNFIFYNIECKHLIY